MGDFNVAPEDRDVHDPAAWSGKVHVSVPEREALARVVGLGFADAFRLFDQPEGSFTWWDYRMNAFRRKMGLRIDHVLLSPALVSIRPVWTNASWATSCRPGWGKTPRGR